MRWLVAVFIVVAFGTASAEVLVAGKPPLTQDMVDRTCNFLEWALDVQLTAEQRVTARDTLVTSWKHSQSDIDGEVKLLAAYEQLVKATPEQREQARAKVTPALVAQLKQAKDPVSRWLAGVYDAAHTVLVTGNPPLTKQMIDAYAEYVAFVLTQATGKEQKIDTKIRVAWTKQITGSWAKADKAQQTQFALMPSQWAGLRTAWANASEADRAKLREQWRSAIATQVDPHNTTESVMAKIAIEKMRHETVMGMLRNMNGEQWHYEYRWVNGP